MAKMLLALSRGSIIEITEDPAVAAKFATRGHRIVAVQIEPVDVSALVKHYQPKDHRTMYPEQYDGYRAPQASAMSADVQTLAKQLALEMLAHMKAQSMPVPTPPPLPVLPPPPVPPGTVLPPTPGVPQAGPAPLPKDPAAQFIV